MENETVSVDLARYLTDPDAVITTDLGNVSAENIWSFIPNWGAEPVAAAHCTAANNNATMILTVNLTITPNDTTPPTQELPPGVSEHLTINSPDLLLECISLDWNSGMSNVVMRWKSQELEATFLDSCYCGGYYNGIITGLDRDASTEIIITAYDNSINHNSSTLKLTVTYGPDQKDEQ